MLRRLLPFRFAPVVSFAPAYSMGIRFDAMLNRNRLSYADVYVCVRFLYPQPFASCFTLAHRRAYSTCDHRQLSLSAQSCFCYFAVLVVVRSVLYTFGEAILRCCQHTSRHSLKCHCGANVFGL